MTSGSLFFGGPNPNVFSAALLLRSGLLNAEPLRVLSEVEGSKGRRANVAQSERAGFLVRVPHASGLLDGTVTRETTFAETDHRYHRVSTDERKRLWQEEGLKKVEQLGFLMKDTGRTLGQAALKFILSEPTVASVLPNIYSEKLLTEFATTSDVADLASEELARIAQLHAS